MRIHKEQKSKHRTKKIVALTAALVVVGGAAFAYWTTGGSGSGTAGTGTSANVTVVQTAAAGGLAPGGSTALSGTITNATNTDYDVTAVTAVVTVFSVAADATKPPCTAADFTITGTSTNPPVALANTTGGGAWSGLSLNMVNGALNQDNCKNISVPITYSAPRLILGGGRSWDARAAARWRSACSWLSRRPCSPASRQQPG
jgi:hypothetical protein